MLVRVLIIALLSSLTLLSEGMFYYDGALFKYKDRVLWELYYIFPDNFISYKSTGDSWKGELKINVILQPNVGSILGDEWTVSNTKESKPDEFEMDLVGQRSFLVEPGQYMVQISCTDVNDSTNSFSNTFDLVATNFPENEVSISDLQLSSMIESSNKTDKDRNGMFLKGQLYVVPTPSLEFEGDLPRMFTYLEIYNALKYSSEGIKIRYTVFDGAQRKVFTTEEVKIPVSDNYAQYSTIPLESLPSGVYYIKADVVFQYEEALDSLSRVKKFYVFNYKMPATLEVKYTESEKFQMSEFATMTPEQVELEYRHFRSLMSNYETEEFELLTEHRARQRALFKYWSERDPDTNTVLNEFRAEFRERLHFANTFFWYNDNIKGWQTDRGRIYLKYGKPSVRDQFFEELGRKAAEIWYFPLVEGGVYFYFVDDRGDGNYKLVHSTHPNEIFDPDWVDRYNPNIDTHLQDNKIRSEQEQYYRR